MASRSTCAPSRPASPPTTSGRWRPPAAWRGDLLAGFTLRDSPAFDEWQLREAESLRRALGAASARLVAACGARSRRRGHRPRPALAGARSAARTRPPGPDAPARGARRPRRGRPPVPGVRPHDGRGARRRPAGGDDGALRGDRRGWRGPGPPHRAATVPGGLGRYPFTGRAVEVAALATAIRAGRVVVVEGEPGVGKTRLVEEVLGGRDRLRSWCAATTTTATCRTARSWSCSARRPPIPPPPSSWPRCPGSCAAEASRLVPELARRRRGAAAVGGARGRGPVPGRRHSGGLAAGRGSAGVIVVDDAQWADHATQQVLAHLVHRARERRALPRRHPPHRRGGRLRTARHALADRVRGGGGVGIRLGRLDPAAVASWSPRVDAGPPPR